MMTVNKRQSEAAILVIEDQPMTKRQMENMFGYQFIIRKTGYKAKDLLSKHGGNIRLIIIDDFVKNSIQTLKAIRLLDKSTPVYLMTSHDYLKIEAKQNGATGFIPEPFDVDSFKRIFQKHRDVLEGCLA